MASASLDAAPAAGRAVVSLEDAADAPYAPSAERLRQGIFGGITDALFGLIAFRDGGYRLGRLTLLQLGEPRFEHPAWVWPVEGGLLADRPGGELRVGWNRGQLFSRLDGYMPAIPDPLYRHTQQQFHRQVTRIGLLRLRGRVPSAGIPAEPWRRLLAGGVDVAVAAATAIVVAPPTRRDRFGCFLGALVAGQTLVPALFGQTPGGRVAGVRVAALDGRPPSLLQLLVRLVARPRGLRGLRDRHDELAATEVLLSRPESE